MKGNLLYFYPAVSLQRTRELSVFLFHVLSLSTPGSVEAVPMGVEMEEGKERRMGEEGAHKHADTHAEGKNGTEESEWVGGGG